MKITALDALGISVLGMVVVFLVLVLLMIVIVIMTAITKRIRKAAAVSVGEAAGTPAANHEPARGSCGEISLYDVPDRTAAMIMAIVADEMDAPLNELRFISIREAEDNADEV